MKKNSYLVASNSLFSIIRFSISLPIPEIKLKWKSHNFSNIKINFHNSFYYKKILSTDRMEKAIRLLKI